MPSITPSLGFDNDLEEAAEFYESVFPNSKIAHYELVECRWKRLGNVIRPHNGLGEV
jgi:predicted 3-demethylubiquinone-9 3-methyltransferase (glyoxalase superfamily)